MSKFGGLTGPESGGGSRHRARGEWKIHHPALISPALRSGGIAVQSTPVHILKAIDRPSGDPLTSISRGADQGIQVLIPPRGLKRCAARSWPRGRVAKLGDERSGTDLFNTIRNQLLTKYMAADECRAGCLLVTIAREREWEHPQTGERIGVKEFEALLSEEAQRLSKELGGTVNLMAKVLDLRPRLRTEAARRVPKAGE
jgi:hypothetical protein